MKDMDVVGGRPGSSRAAFQRSQIGKGGGGMSKDKAARAGRAAGLQGSRHGPRLGNERRVAGWCCRVGEMGARC